MQPIAISAAGARRFLVTRHLLLPARSATAGLDGVRVVFARLGSVQFDPLAVAGRNHDLVLHARVRDYDPAWTDALLYGSRELFEAYNKGLSLLPTSELPWHRHTWSKFATYHQDRAFTRYAASVEHVLARIREHGPLCSLDFERSAGAIDWYWGLTSEIRAVLEALAEAGVLGLAHRRGNRRYYDLTERLFPAELLGEERPDREQRRHRLLSRYRAHGLLGEGGQSELWYGVGPARAGKGDPPGTVTRTALREELVDSGELVPVSVEGLRGRRFVLGGEVTLLLASASAADRADAADGASVVFLAPLDPLAWDRDLLRRLFDFDYVWEVYVPEAKRRWGYYVLPIMWGDRLVGRIEPRFDRAAGTVRVLGLWWERGFRPSRDEGFVEAMRDALGAYARFGGVQRLDWGTLGAEKRRFGVRIRA